MSIENNIRIIKEIHPEDVVCVKIGSFYHAYGKDAYIMSYLFGYKLKDYTELYKTCGFPADILNKVCCRLEKENISYVIVDRRDNYDVTAKENFTPNMYEKIFSKAVDYINLKNRISGINRVLLENITKQDIQQKFEKIEELLFETR